MKKIIKNMNEISGEDVFAIAYAVSDGIWVNGFFNHHAFEAKVNDSADRYSIDNGRVSYLSITAKYYTEYDSFNASVARYSDGEWLMRPNKFEDKKMIDTLVSYLERLPRHKEFEPEQKQTA